MDRTQNDMDFNLNWLGLEAGERLAAVVEGGQWALTVGKLSSFC